MRKSLGDVFLSECVEDSNFSKLALRITFWVSIVWVLASLVGVMLTLLPSNVSTTFSIVLYVAASLNFILSLKYLRGVTDCLVFMVDYFVVLNNMSKYLETKTEDELVEILQYFPKNFGETMKAMKGNG